MPHLQQPPLRVGFILLPLFTLNAFAGFIDSLRLAADKGGRSRQIHCSWQIMGPGPVTSSCGLEVHPQTSYRDPCHFTHIAVCGGNNYLDPHEDKGLSDYLKEACKQGVKLVGVCTGTFSIARAGLLKGQRVCVHWNVINDFRQQFPQIDATPDRLFLESARVITCAGSSGATDMALHLIRRRCGPEKAQQAIRHMILNGMRTSNSPQTHFFEAIHEIRDERVRVAVLTMEQSLNARLDTQGLAERINLSPRQLDRLFRQEMGTTPMRYFKTMRLRYAEWLLHHTDSSVAEIAADCGFADAAHLSRDFTTHYGCNPSESRRRGHQPHAASVAYG
ncbi:GlxA family transcriptional regulator [Halomonas salipaludis]|uniref:AraC family transcriptional regulator n=1 Tax=Halomonas salipaludis TaxID=2032625 RepID=A0A2A2ERS7_9GAMM|nr:GlxA family transcriptional regulator [Halomonas salipaludis]PAU76131.1 AraC family transcriptional regulator [Halomonas salipaludis]